MPEHQMQEDETQLIELNEDLARFEQAYGMSSIEFNARYQRGEMGDDIEVFEWHVLYQMRLRLEEAIQIRRNRLA